MAGSARGDGRIVVAGEALVDVLVQPDGRLAAVPGGSPFNVARAIARLGLPVAFLGVLSRDRFGDRLDAALAADGIDRSLVHRSDAPTTLALAELDASGTAAYRFYLDGTSAPGLPADAVPAFAAGTAAFHVGSLGLVLEPIGTLLEAAALALPPGILLSVDPNCRPGVVADPAAYRARLGRLMARAAVVKASAEDLAFLRPGEAPLEAARAIAASGAAVVAVTDGDRPVTVLAGGEEHRLAVPAVEVVDSVGAGDTFGGALLAALVHAAWRPGAAGEAGLVLAAAGLAVRAGAAVCARRGAESPTLAELGGWPESEGR